MAENGPVTGEPGRGSDGKKPDACGVPGQDYQQNGEPGIGEPEIRHLSGAYTSLPELTLPPEVTKTIELVRAREQLYKDCLDLHDTFDAQTQHTHSFHNGYHIRTIKEQLERYFAVVFAKPDDLTDEFRSAQAAIAEDPVFSFQKQLECYNRTKDKSEQLTLEEAKEGLLMAFALHDTGNIYTLTQKEEGDHDGSTQLVAREMYTSKQSEERSMIIAEHKINQLALPDKVKAKILPFVKHIIDMTKVDFDRNYNGLKQSNPESAFAGIVELFDIIENDANNPGTHAERNAGMAQEMKNAGFCKTNSNGEPILNVNAHFSFVDVIIGKLLGSAPSEVKQALQKTSGTKLRRDAQIDGTNYVDFEGEVDVDYVLNKVKRTLPKGKPPDGRIVEFPFPRPQIYKAAA